MSVRRRPSRPADPACRSARRDRRSERRRPERGLHAATTGRQRGWPAELASRASEHAPASRGLPLGPAAVPAAAPHGSPFLAVAHGWDGGPAEVGLVAVPVAVAARGGGGLR